MTIGVSTRPKERRYRYGEIRRTIRAAFTTPSAMLSTLEILDSPACAHMDRETIIHNVSVMCYNGELRNVGSRQHAVYVVREAR